MEQFRLPLIKNRTYYVQGMLPAPMVSLTLGSGGLFGEKPHPRVYGTYPYIPGQYVREEKLLDP